MRVVILVSLFLFLATALCCAQNNESLTITTYYPSPYGSYNELRAHQMGIGTSAAYFTGVLPANSLIVEGNVGIGTSAPGQKLDVVGTIRASTDVCLTSGTCLSSVAAPGCAPCGASPCGTVGAPGTFCSGCMCLTWTTVCIEGQWAVTTLGQYAAC